MSQPVHTSALCFLLEEGTNAYNKVQSIRSTYDRQINRWPPHINIVYPFVPLDQFETAQKDLQTAITQADLKAFDVSFDAIGYFQQKRGCTGWLKTESKTDTSYDPFQHVFQVCNSLFPYSTRPNFTPHMTIGQFTNKSSVEQAIQTVNWQPITVKVEKLYLISRKGKNDPFKIHNTVQLCE